MTPTYSKTRHNAIFKSVSIFLRANNCKETVQFGGPYNIDLDVLAEGVVSHPAQHSSWRTTPSQMSETANSVYLQLQTTSSTLERVMRS